MTGPHGYGQHPNDPRQQQPGTWPPVTAGPAQAGTWPPIGTGATQPGTWPPVATGPTQTHGPAGQGTPELTPTPPRRRRRRLIIGAVVVAVIAAGATGLVIMQQSNDSAPKTIKMTDPLPREYYMPDEPAGVLATAAELKEITQLDLVTNGAKPVTVPAPDRTTTPMFCGSAISPNNTHLVGSASQFIGQQFTDSSGNSAWVGLAFFDQQEDAWFSSAQIAGELQTCGNFTATGEPGGGTSSWTLTDVSTGIERESWTATRAGGDKPLKCTMDYIVKGNVAAMTSLCTANPSNAFARKIDDMMLDKATTKH